MVEGKLQVITSRHETVLGPSPCSKVALPPVLISSSFRNSHTRESAPGLERPRQSGLKANGPIGCSRHPATQVEGCLQACNHRWPHSSRHLWGMLLTRGLYLAALLGKIETQGTWSDQAQIWPIPRRLLPLQPGRTYQKQCMPLEFPTSGLSASAWMLPGTESSLLQKAADPLSDTCDPVLFILNSLSMFTSPATF